MEFALALPPQSSEAFLREVDDELRRDQMLGFWKRYGRWLVAAVIGGLAVLAGVMLWQNHKQEQAGADGVKLQAALRALSSGREGEATQPLAELTHASSPAYRALAMSTQADLLLRKNDLDGAAARFGAIAADATLPQPLRDIALVRQTMAEFDRLPPQQVIDRLRPLAVKGAPWYGSAGEMVAISYLRLGKSRQAAQLLAGIARDETAPATLRERAIQLAGSLGVDAIVQKEDIKP